MNWYLYILGIVICAMSGYFDENPTSRQLLATTIYTIGLCTLLYSTGALKL